jgi:hypothetical protein
MTVLETDELNLALRNVTTGDNSGGRRIYVLCLHASVPRVQTDYSRKPMRLDLVTLVTNSDRMVLRLGDPPTEHWLTV